MFFYWVNGLLLKPSPMPLVLKLSVILKPLCHLQSQHKLSNKKKAPPALCARGAQLLRAILLINCRTLGTVCSRFTIVQVTDGLAHLTPTRLITCLVHIRVGGKLDDLDCLRALNLETNTTTIGDTLKHFPTVGHSAIGIYDIFFIWIPIARRCTTIKVIIPYTIVFAQRPR